MGKGVEIREKGEIFTVPGEKKYDLGKKGGGISNFWEIYTPAKTN